MEGQTVPMSKVRHKKGNLALKCVVQKEKGRKSAVSKSEGPVGGNAAQWEVTLRASCFKDNMEISR